MTYWDSRTVEIGIGTHFNMAKCDEGYICEICGRAVEQIVESDLYLRYVIGRVDAETLHTTPERHIRCNPVLAQFIVDVKFTPVTTEGDFDKRLLDPSYVAEEEQLVTQGWRRLKEVVQQGLPVTNYPLPDQ